MFAFLHRYLLMLEVQIQRVFVRAYRFGSVVLLSHIRVHSLIRSVQLSVDTPEL